MKLIPNICGKGAPNFPSFCGAKAYFKGITDASTPQGVGFDLLQGVTAHDEYGQQIPFTVSPSEVVACQLGVQTFTYEAEGVTKTRNITVTPIANPTISGVPSTPLTVEVGETFDPLSGVTAVDGNGNTITVTAQLLTYRTVIYADGTLIINERSDDIASNVTKHGTASHVYDAMKSDGSNYVWTSEPSVYWHESQTVKDSITAVEIGSVIKPTSTAYWFYRLDNCVEVDMTNLDTSRVTSMKYMFAYVGYGVSTKDAVPYLDLTMFDTSNVTDMSYMFNHLYGAKVIDVSTWDTSALVNTTHLFGYCNLTETIYASSQFVVPNTAEYGFFLDCHELVGGSGTAYADVDPSLASNSTYARIDNPPTAPGYFTVKA